MLYLICAVVVFVNAICRAGPWKLGADIRLRSTCAPAKIMWSIQEVYSIQEEVS